MTDPKPAKPAKPAKPNKPNKPNNPTAEKPIPSIPSMGEIKAKLAALRDDIVDRQSRGRFICAESQEWAKLEMGHKMALLLLSGIDGDIGDLAERDWREIPYPEQQAIRIEVRAVKRAFAAVAAIAGHW